ncbi:MAG: RagB/SusD family nutrient uptake outer membrane protein [Bacteroides sp.]|nr:RagB/SusD family nutrient uptake outer membrane protein [Bacteroides sp.]MCM1379195.1 RagB/SusD family nutrient uptake outer membrane protein [Bacteroides sp.]MCM1445156.1 RagB/SusD family nutrient uptake outer membrane protein [Prevotella sp.]
MKTIKYIALAALAFTATSCANFLEEEPKGQMVNENFFQTETDLNLALNALYHQVQASQTNSNSTIVQLQGDDITVFNTAKNPYYTSDTFRPTSDFKGVEALWLGKYRVIQAANLIVDNADRAKDNASAQAILNTKGNALFWRACAYFELVRVFGPLPVNAHNEVNFNTTMTSVGEIYNMIITDLLTADSYNLPASYAGTEYKYGNTDGCNYWVTQQAVKSALAAVYMARAGYPFYDANAGETAERTEWYKKAADMAYAVIKGVNDKKYDNQMESDWKMVYPYGNNWSKEQIITISFFGTPGSMGDHNTNGDVSQFSLCQLIEQFQGGWGDFIGERLWWSKFPDGPRKRAVYEPSIYTGMKDEVAGTDDIMQVNWWATNNEKEYTGSNGVVTVYHPTFASMITNTKGGKDSSPSTEPYDCTKPAYQGQQIPANHRYIRYSEVICWFAEAVGRGNIAEYEADAQTELQKVLDRAYDENQAPSTAGLTGAALANLAFTEHGYEVTGYPVALCTRRSDQFRMDMLKDTWKYRLGNDWEKDILVPANTRTLGYKTVSIKVEGEKRPVKKIQAMDYTLGYDLKTPENVPMAETWNGYESMYMPYPPTEVIKNPNIKRVSAFN